MAWGKSESEPDSEPKAGCPDWRKHYVTKVNKGSISMGSWQGDLNGHYRSGYRLVHVFEQDGNTVQVFEHHGH